MYHASEGEAPRHFYATTIQFVDKTTADTLGSSVQAR